MLGVITSSPDFATDSTESALSSPNTSNSSHTAESPLHSPALPTSDLEVVPFATRFAKFFRKYFLEGQRLNDKHQLETEESAKLQPVLKADQPNSAPPQYNLHNDSNCSPEYQAVPLYEKYRKYIGFLLPFVMMHLAWWPLAIRYNIFSLYPTRYELAVTMVLGATVAGMTSEGGGAIAFPVMTLMLKINPTVARDFSLMIQSCGMTTAAFTIVWMRVKVEWHSIIVCSAGATVGIVTGLEFVDHLLTGPQKKMLFVSIWFSFALSLFLLNTQKKRLTYETIQNFNLWKGTVLFITGFVGGLCSAFAGSGLDICSFSVITLLFRVSEKVATPTSVVLMGFNTCVGFYWRELIMSDISQLAWEYFAVSVPVVVICAPLGSLLGSHFHRLVLAGFIYVLEIAAVVGFLCTRPDPILVVVGIIIVCVSFVFFLGISRLGKYLYEDRLQHPSNRLLLNGKKQSHMIGPMIEGPIKGSNGKKKMKESALV